MPTSQMFKFLFVRSEQELKAISLVILNNLRTIQRIDYQISAWGIVVRINGYRLDEVHHFVRDIVAESLMSKAIKHT